MYVLIYFYLSHNLIVSKNYFIFFLIQKEKKNFINKKFFLYIYLSKKLILKLYKNFFFYFKHLDFLILFSLEKGLFLNRN